MRSAARAAALSAPGRDAYAARPFAASAVDLAAPIDPARPVASTDAVLAACLCDAAGGRPEAAAVRRWTVAARLDALAAVREAGGARTEWVGFQCDAPACGERFEAEIDLAACRAASAVSTVDFVVDGTAMTARLPTGDDQARWQAERTPLQLVAASLLASTEPAGADVVDALDAALARVDPARELALELACPACAAPQRRSVDLEAQLLGAFAREQRMLLGQVVRLAGAFHWSEAAILAMPAWRRAFYLGRLEAEDVDEVRR